MLVFAAIVPSTPLLMPEIAKEHESALAGSRAALQALSSRLREQSPDALVVISSVINVPRISIGVRNIWRGSLKQFGVLTDWRWHGSVAIAQKLLSCQLTIPFGAVTEQELDHKSIVALSVVLKEMPQVPIIPLIPSFTQEPAQQVRMSAALSDVAQSLPQRLGLIAVGDTSHHLSEAAPGGYRAEGAVFDHELMLGLKKKAVGKLLDLSEVYPETRKETGLLSFLPLVAIIAEMHTSWKLYAYEAPFGIGYLTAEYTI